MAADLTLQALDDKGAEILDELQRRTEVLPYRTTEPGERSYYLSATKAGMDAFDAMLDLIDPAWREHVSR